MIHLRIVVPSYQAEHALGLLDNTPSVCNLIYLERAAQRPQGDVILCDVAREDASVIISDLRELNVDTEGSIAIEEIDSEISAAAAAAERAAGGLPGDAVVWEEVESRTSESTELSVNFLAFMSLACMIATVAILLDSPILIIGAMVVGPDFGPIAGLSVAIVSRRREFARRSLVALAIGFPVGITAAFVFCLALRLTDLAPGAPQVTDATFLRFIAHPDAFSVIVAMLAGSAGVLSLTAQKSSALMGVLISVATIPAAANIGVAAAYADWSTWRGAQLQLVANLTGLLVAAIGTLVVQRLVYARRRIAHLDDAARTLAGLPLGQTRGAALRAARKRASASFRRDDSHRP
ncbi:MAG TPA: DUF389 domain-containing protein [Solirubrobacterales bacterium]|nr:DUF389 domain-containing protein [Solirubrobacterales bacterium]